MLEDKEHRYRGGGRPLLLPGEDGRHSPLDVQPTEDVAGVIGSRLDLDDQEHAADEVKGEDVDPSAVAEVVEAVLYQHRPAMLAEHPGQPVLQLRIARVLHR